MNLLHFLLLLPTLLQAFHIPHAGHHHPIYVRYREELHQQKTTQLSQSAVVSCRTENNNVYTQVVSPEISTPIDYDEETGMVQTAVLVRAIAKHPVSQLMDNKLVGLSSTLVMTTGALHEIWHAIELDLANHANTGSGLAILSLGHFFHYGKEALRELTEFDDQEEPSISSRAS